MKFGLIGLAVTTALSGCASAQKDRCNCCQVSGTEVASFRLFAALSGIYTSSRNNGRAHQ